MARRIRSTDLETRAARTRLKPQGKPYYRLIEPTAHLGYRKPRGRKGKPAGPGKWVQRDYIGGAYMLKTIGTADDFSDADGVAVLDYWQAVERVRERMVHRVHAAAGVSGPLTVKAALGQYFEALEGEGRSAYDARTRAEAFIIPKFGDIEVASLTPDVLRRWHAALAKTAPRLRTKPGQPQNHRAHDGSEEAIRRRRVTTNRLLAILKAALNRAFHDGKVPSDTAWRKVKPFRAVTAARARYLSVAEAQRLINAADPEFRLLLRAALETGARYGELTRLQMHDFNGDAGTLAVWKSKSGKSRHVVLTSDGIAFFRQITAGRSGNALMFTHKDGSAWGKAHQDRPMRAACQRAAIKPVIGFHGLRHSWASHAVMNGVPIMVVARNLGHADTRMVERHYGHLAPSYVADAIRAGAPKWGLLHDTKVTPLRS